MPYLRAVIKESLRLFPITLGTVRQTTKDVVISGYKIPANTHVAMQPIFDLTSDKIFPNGKEFLPERWLRDESENHSRAGVTNPFTFLPFGFGARR